MKHLIITLGIAALPVLSFSQTRFVASSVAQSGEVYRQGTASMEAPGGSISNSQRSSLMQQAQNNAREAARAATGKPARVVPNSSTIKKVEVEKKRKPKYSTF